MATDYKDAAWAKSVKDLELAGRICTLETAEFDLSSAITDNSECLYYNPYADIVIHDIQLVYSQVPVASSSIDIGTNNDTDGVVDAFASDAGVDITAIGQAEEVTLATALAKNFHFARNKPVVMAGERLFWRNSASGGDGIAKAFIHYWVIGANDRGGR